MPPNDVTFLAFGQDHRNAEALRDLTARIKELHAADVPVVLCVEHGPEATAESELKLLQYKAAVGGYFDQCLKNLQSNPSGPGPDKASFNKATAHVYDNVIEQGADFYRYVSSVNFQTNWEANELCGRSAAATAELELMEFAIASGIPVKGLDLPKKEVLYRAKGADAAEFRRIDHMAEQALEHMQSLADDKGGVVIALNMGASHVGNLEARLLEKVSESQLPQQANIQVQSCVMLDDPENGPAVSVVGHEAAQGLQLLHEGAQRIERHAEKMAENMTLEDLEKGLAKQVKGGTKCQKILETLEQAQLQNLADLKANIETIQGEPFDDVAEFQNHLSAMVDSPGGSSFAALLNNPLGDDLTQYPLAEEDAKLILNELKQAVSDWIKSAEEMQQKTAHQIDRLKAGVPHEGREDWQFSQRAKTQIDSKISADPTRFLRPDKGSYTAGLNAQMAPVLQRHAPALPLAADILPAPAPLVPVSPVKLPVEDVRASLQKSELRQRKVSHLPHTVGGDAPELAAPARAPRIIPPGKLKTD